MAVTQVGEYKNLWAVFRYVKEKTEPNSSSIRNA